MLEDIQIWASEKQFQLALQLTIDRVIPTVSIAHKVLLVSVLDKWRLQVDRVQPSEEKVVE